MTRPSTTNRSRSTQNQLAAAALLLALMHSTGCYRMPQEGEVSVVPITNNPAVTRQQQSTFLPGMNQ